MVRKPVHAIVEVYQHLTPAEKKFVREHPGTAITLYQDAVTASTEARRRYPHELHNGRGDAFRHTYWSALMTKHVGESLARKYGYAHEAEAPQDQPRNEREMDQHNNAVGRSIGVENPTASDNVLADAVEQALDSGRLMQLH